MATPILFGDFETRSEADLRNVGLWNYAHHPSTDVLCFGYAFDDGVAHLWWPGKSAPSARLAAEVREHVAAGGTFVAHNAPFELAIWNRVMVPKHGWPALDPRQAVCTMARAYAMALPGSLDNAARALSVTTEKDKEGHALMMRLSAPTNKKEVSGGRPAKWATDQESFTFLGKKVTPEWALRRLGEYCKTDVIVEREIYKRTLPLSRFERKAWVLDRKINERGILFDQNAVTGAVKIKADALVTLNTRMAQITGGEVQSCTALPALKSWMEGKGCPHKSLAKGAVADILAGPLPGDVRAALELRQEADRGTSIAKLETARRLAGEDGRIRNVFQYHGASTGRFAGRGLQPHNFPRDLPKPKVADLLMELIQDGDAAMLEALYGNPLSAISRLLRAFMIPEPGKVFVGGDWSNVEGRGLAWLAGEEWKVKAFELFDQGKGPDLYKKTYSESFGVPVALVDDDQRQVGKVQELAFGYGGGKGAFRQMGSKFGLDVSDEKAEEFKVAWRDAHPMTVQFWAALQKAAIRAIQRPGTVTSTADPGNRYGLRFKGLSLPPASRDVKFKVAKPGPFLYCRLPSGRTLTYPYPRLVDSDFGPRVTYMSVPSAEDWMRKRVVDDPKNTRQWARLGTYGGKLAENVNQAICRDILVEKMVELDDLGYETAIHVHDEIVVEGLFSEEDRTRIQSILQTTPDWAGGLPLAAECWIAKRYQK